MSSLVADYGSSSDSNSSSIEELNHVQEKERAPTRVEHEKLPLPKFGEEGILGVTNSVFKNPFVEEENAKSAILEKHVKMIPAKEDITKINGKQICWMYRKGRCRFGHNCKFAHDSDLHSENTTETEQSELSATSDSVPPGPMAKSDRREVLVESDGPKKKKRPGLSQGLVPGKKVMNMYKKQKLSGSSTSSKV